MPSGVTEWEFSAESAGWINAFVQRHFAPLAFNRAKVEQRGSGSRKRRDLTLLDKTGAIVLTGELKMPWSIEGVSPFVESLVADARAKSDRAKCEWFFTWNVNELVLWKNTRDKRDAAHRHFKRYPIAAITLPEDLNDDRQVSDLKINLVEFLADFSRLLAGEQDVQRRPADDYFVEALESFLERPIQVATWELGRRGADLTKQAAVKEWMRKEQGWVLDAEDARNWDRAARFACYGVVNRVVFYEALRKRFSQLPELRLSKRLQSGEELVAQLQTFFARAQKVSGDYETVFGIDRQDTGSRIPFYAKESVAPWSALVAQIDGFDFAGIEYDVIGRIFERLIAPEERHKYGQYYTRVEVVDLINSFCIRTPEAKVLDPGCGGGTFLVRAYARKKKLDPNIGHAEIIASLHGVDVAHFAAHLTMINLATKELIEAANYPRIVRSDFFDLAPARPFMTLPGGGPKGPGSPGKNVTIELREVDAVVANPPYVRQEDIPRAIGHGPNGAIPHGTKDFYRSVVEGETGVRLSGRSDLHCYFWGHGSAYLRPGGWLGFLTSSQWLDVEYGFNLQGWLLDTFRIVAILESRVEPWFVGARVATAITVAQRENDAAKRNSNSVRFVELRRPLKDFLLGDGTSQGMIEAADNFRDEISSATGDRTEERFRLRLVRQGELHRQGVALGRIIAKQRAGDETDEAEELPNGELAPDAYFGGKWGIHLRAPDVWFRLQERTKGRWRPFGDMAEIRFGVKTGADEFFYVRDVTKEQLDKYPTSHDFKRAWSQPREAFESGGLKLIKSGIGEVSAIEARFLEPELHSLMEIDGYVVGPENCSRLIFLCGLERRELRQTLALRYIQRGEELRYHLRPTCAGRITKPDPKSGSAGREWYDLTGRRRGSLFFMKSSQYKHSVPTNPANLVCNCNLYDVFPRTTIGQSILAGILNSSLTVLSKNMFGRPVGVEGGWKTEVVDVNMMLVPDPEIASAKLQQRVAEAFERMAQRKALSFLSERRLRRMAATAKGRQSELVQLSDESELDQADRRELDDAVLQLLGIESGRERMALLDALYEYLRAHYEGVRAKEEEGIQNKKRAARGSRLTPDEFAAQIVTEIREKRPELLREYFDILCSHVAEENRFGRQIPERGVPEIVDDMISTGVRFATSKKGGEFLATRHVQEARLVKLVAEAQGLGQDEFFPVRADDAEKVEREFRKLLTDRSAVVEALVKDRTADTELQEQVIARVLELVRHGRNRTN